VSDTDLRVDGAYATALFDELFTRTEDARGVTRVAYGPGEEIGHEIVRREASALGLAQETDAAGNLYVTYAGTDPSLPAWIVGSHIDSVPHGGNFDGAAGVFAGLAAIRALARQGIRPARPVSLMVIRAEESCWFPISYLGSRAAFGKLPAESLSVKRSDSGLTLSAHLKSLGFDPDGVAAGMAHLAPERIAGFVELHIEQGPVLENAEVPVGLVTAIAGSFRYRKARCLGEWGHSGAVPKGHRRDAVVALSELIVAMEAAWQRLLDEGEQATVTFGEVGTDPAVHGFSKIPGEVAFCLDARSGSPAVLERLDAELMGIVAEIEAQRGVRFELGEKTGSTPAVLDAGLRASFVALARETGTPYVEMASGAGHDTATFANAGVPAALIFLRNQNGSHNPEEAMRMEDFVAAADLLARFLVVNTG
jgi:beta-ureidopropionase / N-carbamoyl-L-amino-acid hydrolase